MRKGFTLVEVMIVVAIIALLAAIAIPSLLRMRHNANETAAIATLKTLSTAEEAYRANQNPPTYGTLANLLTPASGPAYIDATLASGAKQGYNFAFTNGPTATAFTITATPQVVGQTGSRIFRVDETGVVFDVTNSLPIE